MNADWNLPPLIQQMLPHTIAGLVGMMLIGFVLLWAGTEIASAR